MARKSRDLIFLFKKIFRYGFLNNNIKLVYLCAQIAFLYKAFIYLYLFYLSAFIVVIEAKMFSFWDTPK